MPTKLLNLLALLAFLARVYVPVGFMPDLSALKAGYLRIQHCPHHQPAAAKFAKHKKLSPRTGDANHEGGSEPGENKSSGEVPTNSKDNGGNNLCPFAVAAHRLGCAHQSNIETVALIIARITLHPIRGSTLFYPTPLQSPASRPRAPPDTTLKLNYL